MQRDTVAVTFNDKVVDHLFDCRKPLQGIAVSVTHIAGIHRPRNVDGQNEITGSFFDHNRLAKNLRARNAYDG